MNLFFILIIILIPNSLLGSSELSISTTSGIANGEYKNKVIFFEDIPYAEPPVNELRWKAPREASVVDIFPKEDNFCIQRPSNLGGVDGSNFFVGSEDCLYLDILIPKKNNIKKLPVMFWIHGGGNTSGLKDLYDFSKMVSRHNVIVVRVNYRLGPFGWFTHPAIQDLQDGEDKTSNFGTLDLIMALKWINKNISNFGGDPQNVTIFGESAGGHNVLSLLVAEQAKGLFHKAISMSGYTTSISKKDAHKPLQESATSEYSSARAVKKLLINKKIDLFDQNDYEKTRELLLNTSAEDIFNIYAQRASYEEIPLLTADGMVIPEIGLKRSLLEKKHVNIVPTMMGSNRDEVKLWLATAKYFVDLEYSLIGSVLRIPKVKLINEESFEAFNFYRSSAWKIRGVDIPLNSLASVGNDKLYAYRYDWDDHRRLVVADFKKLIGAAHATEIPLLTGNNDLVGGYPLSDLIYPPSFSKRYTSKNIMRFWTNFAKFGDPGDSTNSVSWNPYTSSNQQFMIIDKKKNLKMSNNIDSFKSLTNLLINDYRVSDIEKCVILFQMFTYVGEDLYDKNIPMYPKNCSRTVTEKFLKDNASFIEY
jgi:para-nitrobenzyl esterase